MSFFKIDGKIFFPPQNWSFSFFSQISKNPRDRGGANVDAPGENFNIGNLAENEMAYCQHI